jgi:hypothetical protein
MTLTVALAAVYGVRERGGEGLVENVSVGLVLPGSRYQRLSTPRLSSVPAASVWVSCGSRVAGRNDGRNGLPCVGLGGL